MHNACGASWGERDLVLQQCVAWPWTYSKNKDKGHPCTGTEALYIVGVEV